MDEQPNRNRLIAGAAIGALLFGGAGIMIGRTALVPTTATEAPKVDTTEATPPAGVIEMNAARAQAAGIVTEAVLPGSLQSEIIAQGVVAATPDGEAALTARADGAITRISKRLGDSVRAGEAVATIESRDASTIAAERSTASAKAIAARAGYAREKRLFDARVTARQDLEAAAAVLAEAEAEVRRTSAAASAAKVSGDGRSLSVVSLISGRITKADAKLGAYVLAGAELFRVADPSRIQINASVLPVDARRIRPGATAVIELLGGETTTATVRSATPSLDAESRTATIVLTPNGIGGLTPGQGLRVRVKATGVSTQGGGMTVPDEAVQTLEGREVVFVRTGQGFRAQPVVTGQRSAGRVAIVSGLRAGAVIATRNAFLLKADAAKGAGEEE